MEKFSQKTNHQNLKRSIQEIIYSVEIVMTGIHDLIGEMGTLIQQIDITAERIENKLQRRLKQKEIILDANQNQCDTSELLLPPSNSNISLPSPFIENGNSKQTLPSPFLDYTYLELMSDCDVCVNKLSTFTYNEKYPLWIQYDTWRTGNSPSDVSFVSSGSDAINTKSESNNNSWKSAGHPADSHHNKIVKFKTDEESDEKPKRFDTCCNTEDNQSGIYCGVYEQLMEERLESEYFYHDAIRHEDRDVTFDSSDIKSNCSLSLSDEQVVHFNKSLNTWTAYTTENVFFESACSTCS